MRKLYEIFKLLWIQKRIVAAATKGWFDEFETALNIIVAIVQKVQECQSCPLAKMMSLGVYYFGKRTVL